MNSITTNPCEICNIDPKSHSFNIIPCNNPDITLFYSCPSDATKEIMAAKPAPLRP